MKSRRAANDQDYETWIDGAVAPTLNAFDNATDTRAVILIPILMRQREGKPGGGKGPLISENLSFTIATANDQILIQEIEVEAIPLDMRNAGRDPEKHDEMNRQGVGVGNEGDPAHTVTSAFVNGVAHEIATVLGNITHALTAEGHDASEDGTGRGTPIIGFQPTDGGFANTPDDRLSTTIKASDAPAVAYEQPYAFSAGNSEKSYGIGLSEGITPPLRASASGTNQTPTITYDEAFDEMNFSTADTHHTLRAGTKQSTGVVTTIVRRLTPTECERLQGFPDGWTAQRIDHKTGQLVEQKDSARYKQMGNAVAVPCVQWILARIMEGTQ